MKELTDAEVDLFVAALLDPSPIFGFSEAEKKEIMAWIKTPSLFVEFAEKRKIPS